MRFNLLFVGKPLIGLQCMHAIDFHLIKEIG